MDVTKPYEFIGFGAMDVTKPYEFIGFGSEAAPRDAKTDALSYGPARGSGSPPPPRRSPTAAPEEGQPNPRGPRSLILKNIFRNLPVLEV